MKLTSRIQSKLCILDFGFITLRGNWLVSLLFTGQLAGCFWRWQSGWSSSICGIHLAEPEIRSKYMYFMNILPELPAKFYCVYPLPFRQDVKDQLQLHVFDWSSLHEYQ